MGRHAQAARRGRGQVQDPGALILDLAVTATLTLEVMWANNGADALRLELQYRAEENLSWTTQEEAAIDPDENYWAPATLPRVGYWRVIGRASWDGWAAQPVTSPVYAWAGP